MGKSGGFLTPKAISNRIKAKGLQKLRWYCQMCQKQCRDENGMKCHMRSEGHLRAMRVFADNPGRVLSEFSQEFERGFLDTLSHGHGTKRVPANRIYQEYIADKHHQHMNSTCWTSLTQFVKYLGREGKCVVDENEKGWFIQYIDRDPKLIAKKALEESRDKAELDEEERMRRMIENQIAAAEKKKFSNNSNNEDDGDMEEESYLPELGTLGRSQQIKLQLMNPVAKRGRGLSAKKSVGFSFATLCSSGKTDTLSVDEQRLPMDEDEGADGCGVDEGREEDGDGDGDDNDDDDDDDDGGQWNDEELEGEEGMEYDNADCAACSESDGVAVAGATGCEAVTMAITDKTQERAASSVDPGQSEAKGMDMDSEPTEPMESRQQQGQHHKQSLQDSHRLASAPGQGHGQGRGRGNVDEEEEPPIQSLSPKENNVHIPAPSPTMKDGGTRPSTNRTSQPALAAAARSNASLPKPAPLSTLESLMREEERRKAQALASEDKRDRREYWLHPGILVKIMSKKLAGGKFYKQKALVLRVLDKYVGEVRVLSDGSGGADGAGSGPVIRIDQEELQTVLPKVGNPVLIVNGRGRGHKATLLKIHEEKFNCDIRVDEGPLLGREITHVDYEDVSKVI